MKKQNQSAVAKPAKPPAQNVYAGMGDVLGAGFGDLMNDTGIQLSVLKLKDIYVDAQIREQFEDETNTMEEMTASIGKHGVFQTVLVRPISDGPAPYKLVAGERRFIGSERAGKLDIPCLIKEMTDEEAADIQLQENIQRKNLTQIEEAKKIQKDLDTLGSVDAVLEKHSKGRAWLSKILSLLKLPEQAKRLVSEKITADLEVINAVKTVEKHDPEAAKALVDDLKKTRGKEDARKKVNAVKDAVKPSKKQAKGIVATPPDLSHQEPGNATVSTLPGMETEGAPSGDGAPAAEQGNSSVRAPALAPAEALNKAYTNIFELGSSPKMLLDVMPKEDRDNIESWLQTFYSAGQQEKNMSRAVIQGFRKGTFSTDGDGAFALLAFLQGADASVTRFNLLNLFGLVKE
jgi:ParB family chromosome partitioning protein